MAADGTIRLEMTANEAKAFASFQRIIDQQTKLKNRTRDTTRATRTGKGAFDSLVGSWTNIGGVIAGFASIQTVIKLISDEIVNVETRWRNAAQTIRTTAGEILPTIASLPPQISALGPDFLQSVVSEGSRAGLITQAEAFRTAQTIGSTIGAGSPELFRNVLVAASRASGITTGEDAPAFGRGATTIANLLGTTSARAALGQVFQLGTGTPITELRLQAQNIPQALSQVIGTGQTFEGAAEIFSVVAQFSNDPTGLRSGTTAATIAGRLRTEEILPTGRGGKREPLPREFVTGRTTLETLQSLSQEVKRLGLDEIEIAAVAKVVGGSIVGQSFVQSFLNDDPRALSVVAAAQRNFEPFIAGESEAALESLFETRITQAEARPEVQAFRLDRAFKAATEGIQLADRPGQLRGIVLGGLDKLLQATPGASAFQRRVERVRGLLEGDADDAVERALGIAEDIQESFEPRTLPPITGQSFDIGPGGIARIGRRVTVSEERFLPGRPEFIEPVGIVVDQLRELSKIMAETRDAIRDRQGAAALIPGGE